MPMQKGNKPAEHHERAEANYGTPAPIMIKRRTLPECRPNTSARRYHSEKGTQKHGKNHKAAL